jgi:hypothetical protein
VSRVVPILGQIKTGTLKACFSDPTRQDMQAHSPPKLGGAGTVEQGCHMVCAGTPGGVPGLHSLSQPALPFSVCNRLSS